MNLEATLHAKKVNKISSTYQIFQTVSKSFTLITTRSRLWNWRTWAATKTSSGISHTIATHQPPQSTKHLQYPRLLLAKASARLIWVVFFFFLWKRFLFPSIVSLLPGWGLALTTSVTLRTAVWITSQDWGSSIWTTTVSHVSPQASQIWNTCRWGETQSRA